MVFLVNLKTNKFQFEINADMQLNYKLFLDCKQLEIFFTNENDAEVVELVDTLGSGSSEQ